MVWRSEKAEPLSEVLSTGFERLVLLENRRERKERRQMKTRKKKEMMKGTWIYRYCLSAAYLGHSNGVWVGTKDGIIDDKITDYRLAIAHGQSFDSKWMLARIVDLELSSNAFGTVSTRAPRLLPLRPIMDSERNIYKDEIDFSALALQDAAFARL